MRAQRRKRTLEKRATHSRTPVVRAQGNNYCSGTRAPGMLENPATRCRTPVVRTQGNKYCSGTRAPGIKTTISGTRATESRKTFGTRAPYNFVLTIDLHTRITKGIVERHNRVPTTLATTHRFHARHRVLKFRHSISQDSNKVMFVGQNEHCAKPIITEFEGARTQRSSPDPNTVMFEKENERCAQPISSEFDDARTQKASSELNTVVIRAEVHAEDTDAEHLVHFEETHDFSDAGSLITQAPQSQSIHATINALSSWVSAIQPRESWYLAGWIGDSPIDFLVDPGAVVSAISLQSYEKLMEANAILTPMRAIHMELEAANKSDMRVHGMCNLDLSVHGLIINMDALVVDLNCHAILGMDSWETRLNYHLFSILWEAHCLVEDTKPYNCTAFKQRQSVSQRQLIQCAFPLIRK